MEITTATGVAGGETTGPEENEEQTGQQLSGESGQVEKGSGYGAPGEGSGETVPADDGSTIPNSGGTEEDRAAALPGTTGSETGGDQSSGQPATGDTSMGENGTGPSVPDGGES